MSKEDDGLFQNTAPSSAAAQLSLALVQRLKAMPSWKMTITEQLLILFLDAMNTRITVLEFARERIEIENRRMKQLFYFMGVFLTVLTTGLSLLGMTGIKLLP